MKEEQQKLVPRNKVDKIILSYIKKQENKDEESSAPELGALIETLERKEKDGMGASIGILIELFKTYSLESKLKYLSSKPDSVYRFYVFKTMPLSCQKKLREGISDDCYYTDLILSCQKLPNSFIEEYYKLVKDPYLRFQLYGRNFKGLDYIVCANNVKKYNSIMEEFLLLKTDEERANYINSMQYEVDEDLEYASVNAMKISLLQHITDPEYLKKAIDGISSRTDNSFKPYVETAKQMITEFLSSQGILDSKVQKSLDIIFKMISVQEADLSNEVVLMGEHKGEKGYVSGDADFWKDASIRIDFDKKYPGKNLDTLIHEFRTSFFISLPFARC